MRTSSLAVLTASFLALSLSACDFKPTVSQSKLEDALTTWLKDHELEAKEIHCPGAQPLEQGHKFECTCEVHGAEIPVNVEVIDAAAGTVEWKPKYLTLLKDNVEKELLEKPQFAEHDVEIDCHDSVWVSIPDSQWKCDITDKGDGNKKYLATFTFTDGDGSHKMEIDEAG